MNGTVSLTAVGLLGEGGGWGMPASTHTLLVTLGGIACRLVPVDGRVKGREHLPVHDDQR